MPNSVLDAIKLGNWDFEPKDIDGACFDSTRALPGTGDKLSVLAARVERGLPLWHPGDRVDYDQ